MPNTAITIDNIPIHVIGPHFILHHLQQLLWKMEIKGNF